MSLECKFYGGTTGAIFSKVWGKNEEITEDNYNSYNINTYIPSWDDKTYLLSKFNNTLDGGSITSSIGTLQSWLLYRGKSGEDSLEFIDELTTSEILYYDFTVINQEVYNYYLFAKGNLSISSPISTNYVQSDYYGWFLIDTEYNKAYQFDINFNGGDKEYIEDFTEHAVNNKTNIFSRGGNFYKEVTLVSVLSKDNLKTDTEDTNDDLHSLSEFINSDRSKLLKSRRGEIFRVIVTEYKDALLNMALGQNILTTTIKVKEIGGI